MDEDISLGYIYVYVFYSNEILCFVIIYIFSKEEQALYPGRKKDEHIYHLYGGYPDRKISDLSEHVQ